MINCLKILKQRFIGCSIIAGAFVGAFYCGTVSSILIYTFAYDIGAMHEKSFSYDLSVLGLVIALTTTAAIITGAITGKIVKSSIEYVEDTFIGICNYFFSPFMNIIGKKVATEEQDYSCAV